MWLHLAAANGHGSALRARKALTERMSAAEIAEAERLAQAWQAKHRNK